MLSGLISSFLEDLVKDAVEQLNKFLVDLLDIALNCQSYITNKHLIKGLDFNKINAVIVKYAIGLSDGDPDHDPVTILTGFFEAVAISVTFLGLYTPLVNIFKTFTKEILKAMGSKEEIDAISSQLITSLIGGGITTLLLVLVFIIIVIFLYVKLIMNGAELMVLKFAIPLTSVGLMDSDGGSFKVAGKKFLQIGFASSLQIILLRFAMALLFTKHPIWAIAFGALSLRGPQLVQDYLFIRQGGGMSGKVQTLANIRRIFK